MPTKPLSELEALVGNSRVTVEDFRIEAGKVEEFARAVTDSNPIYRDETAAREAGLESIPAPLTYPRVSRFPRYQVTDDGTYGFDLGFHPEYVLHGEQAYEYDRPLVVGDVLTGTTTLTDVFQREGGRAGTMTFAVYETEYHDQSGERVLLDRATAIETEGAVDDDDSAGDGADVGDESNRAEEGGTQTDADTTADAPDPVSVDPVRSSGDVAVGDTGPQIVVPDLERRHFVQYAGASGDFNPIHYDEPYARAAGNERVFGQGMFTAGVTSRVVSDWFGVDAVDSFGVRFQSRVFPGDTVVATGEVVDVSGDTVSVDLETQTAAGETLLTGSATATVAD